MRRASALMAVLLVATSWVAALVAAPSVASTSGTAAATVYLAGSLVCHQRPERSFHRDGAQYPVCARCLGLYAGGWFGVLAWAVLAGLGREASRRAQRLSRHARLVLVALALPTLVSLAAARLGLGDASNTARALLALPLGAALGAVVGAVAAGDLR